MGRAGGGRAIVLVGLRSTFNVKMFIDLEKD